MKKKTVLYVLWSIFATIGVILWIIATAYGVVSKQNQKRMELTYAVITELDDTGDDGDSYVDYEFGGEELSAFPGAVSGRCGVGLGAGPAARAV